LGLPNPRPVLHLFDDILLIWSLRLLNVCASVKASLRRVDKSKESWKSTEKDRSRGKDQRHSTRFPGVHLHIRRRPSCFALFVFCMLYLKPSFYCDQQGPTRSGGRFASQSLQKATWRKLYFGLKRRTAVSRVMMALVLFHLALVLFSDFFKRPTGRRPKGMDE
jgi:hypothetical protein